MPGRKGTNCFSFLKVQKRRNNVVLEQRETKNRRERERERERERGSRRGK